MEERQTGKSYFGLLTTIKVVVVVLILAVASIFFLQNSGPTIVHIPFSRPRQVGLVLLLLVAFFAGVLCTLGAVTFVNSKLKKRREIQQAEEEASCELIEEE